MKFSIIIPTTILFCSQLVKCINFNDYNYILDEIKALDLEITSDSQDPQQDSEIYINKRDNETADNALIQQYTAIFKSIGQSGLLPNLLENIASDENQVNNLVGYLNYLLNSSSMENSTLNLNELNINLNITEIMEDIMNSGIISSTLDGLLVKNDTNNAKLSDFVGSILSSPEYVWIGWLIKGLGEGHALTVPWIADLIANTTSKANTNDTNKSEINVPPLPPLINVTDAEPNFNVSFGGPSRDIYIDLRNKRDDSNNNGTDEYSGSLNQFLNNAINTVVNSNLVNSNINDIIIALNNSGIITPLVIEILEKQNLSNLLDPIVKSLYDNGILNKYLDLNFWFIYAKERHIISDFLQYILTDPYYSPPLAKLLRRMESNGVFQYLQDNMYGPHKRN
ncbi:uncharacterized protein KGF55_000687 [Candida pseudojiufengensis]|uniref:uncharacterized protein n=1 Tax=Candida pseudojiufengensis TaxID=497109 RepID=UPI002223FBF1|nr:uncharacterized protein KGF55_000687 [Candida pseudojiufengensis]KAI5966378.1 hypothetical protein KGF55_000687 [Candida pseudojiufengensis]